MSDSIYHELGSGKPTQRKQYNVSKTRDTSEMQMSNLTGKWKKDKKNSNPFQKAIKRASIIKAKNEEQKKMLLKQNMQQNSVKNVQVSQGGGHQILVGEDAKSNPIQNLLNSGQVPLTSNEYLDHITDEIDTKDLFEIVQVFHHKQSRQQSSGPRFMEDDEKDASKSVMGTNDYVVIVLQINAPQLKCFYGNGGYLVQIWKNKKRLYQHVHESKLQNIYLNKTEIAYVLEKQQVDKTMLLANQDGLDESLDEEQLMEIAEKRPYDMQFDFIYAIQPFTQKFARIRIPFEDDLGKKIALYIDDEYLVLAQGNSLKYVKTDDFFQTNPKKKENFDPRQAHLHAKDGVNRVKFFQDYAYTSFSMQQFSINSTGPKKNWLNFGPNQGQSKNLFAREAAPNGGVLEGVQDPIIAKRLKEMQNGQSLYGELKLYDDLESVTLEFKKCLIGPEYTVLAIDHSYSSGANGIIVYAGCNNHLMLQLFKLQTHNFNNLDHVQDMTDDLKDLVELQEPKGAKTQGDQYSDIKIFHTGENQLMTILRTEEGHIDITTDLLKDDLVFDRFTDRLFKEHGVRGGSVKKIIYGAQKLHIELSDKLTYQFNINPQTSKLDYQSRQEWRSVVASVLDESFFKNHIKLFDDMKMLNGLLVLAHGQTVCMYNLTKKKWSYFFNRGEIKKSNQQSKFILQNHESLDEMYEDYLQHFRISQQQKYLNKKEGDRGTKSKNQLQNVSKEQTFRHLIRQAQTEHCYFNRKEYEIIEAVFMPIKTDNYHDLLIGQFGGHLRKLSVLFPKKKVSNYEASNKANPFASGLTVGREMMGQFCDGLELALDIDQQELDEKRAEEPKILMREFQSVCGNIHKDKDYSVTNITLQTNNALFREHGLFESKVHMRVVDKDKGVLAPDIYANEEESSIQKIITIGESSARSIDMINVENCRSNHLLMYDNYKGTLLVYNTDKLCGQKDEDMHVYTMKTLNHCHLMVEISDFDYSPSIKYFMDKECLFYVLRGNLYELNLMTGHKVMHNFERKIASGQYFMLPGREFYFKSKENTLNFCDLNWLSTSQQPHPNLLITNSIAASNSTVFNDIVYDVINNEIATFVSPNKIKVFQSLSQYEIEAQETFKFKERFIAFNHAVDERHALELEQPQDRLNYGGLVCPSPFATNLYALDADQNMIKIWNVGTGKLIKECPEIGYDFKGYKFHNTWNQRTLVHLDRETIIEQLRSETLNHLDFTNTRSAPTPKAGTMFRKSKHAGARASRAMTRSLGADLKDKWRLIRVEASGVVVEKEFQHNKQPGSSLFLGSTNDVLLEFHGEWIGVYQIRNDSNTKFVQEIKRENNISVPIYFTPDFRKFLLIEEPEDTEINQGVKRSLALEQQPVFKTRKNINVYETKDRYDQLNRAHVFDKFKLVEDIYMPEIESVQKNADGNPYIYFSTNNRLCYLNHDDIEQTFDLCSKESILKDKHLIEEKFLSPDEIEYRKDLDSLNYSEAKLANSNWKRKFELKSETVRQINIKLKSIRDKQGASGNTSSFLSCLKSTIVQSSLARQNVGLTSYSKNTLRFLQPYSFNSWRIIELIVNDKLSIYDINLEKVHELMKVILPNGDTLPNILIKNRNLQQLDALLTIIQRSRSNKLQIDPISFDMTPDLMGVTPLHECVNNTYTKAAEEILRLIGNNPLNNHAEVIQDIYADLVETCPMAMSKYFEERMIQSQWSIKHTKGNLKTADDEVEFGVYSNPLICVDQEELEELIFVSESTIQKKLGGESQDQKRLPMQVHVFDFPKLHHFSNPIGRQLIVKISESDDISIFDQKYVQAILEYQWPAIRRAIFKDLLLPYIVFLLAFNYYAIFQFEQQQKHQDDALIKLEGYVVRVLLVLLCIHFFRNEMIQLRNETLYKYLSNLWNYIDVIPLLFVIAAISLSFAVSFNDHSYLGYVKWERYLNAFASFFIWFKFLYFFRIFRNFGHLIQTIIEVLIDMRVFLVILFCSILAFSGTFFILAQNNEGEDVFVETYIESILKIFQLMLGDFDTEKFGTTGYAVVYLMFAVAAIFLIVVMLNLLIAIISDTFANVQSQAQRKMYQEFAQLICESFHLLPEEVKKKYDNQGNYLFISRIQQSGVSSSEAGENVNSGEAFVGITKEEIEALIKKHVGDMKSDIDDQLAQLSITKGRSNMGQSFYRGSTIVNDQMKIFN